LKKVEIVKINEIEVKPFRLNDFIEKKDKTSSMETVSKKEIKHLAKKLGLVYDDKQIQFTKKLMVAYLAKR